MKTAIRTAICSLLTASTILAADPAQPVVWDFESDEAGWRPRAETVRVSRAEGAAAAEDGKACLRISGRIENGWNYAISANFPMTGGQLYRLSAQLRVDKAGSGTPMPYLKCEFLPESGRGTLGRSNTQVYDAADLGAWQLLVGEFQAPEGTGQAWLALEKGTGSPAEIDAYLDRIKLEPIDRLSVCEQYRLDPLPRPLEAVRGVHPRIYLTAERVAELREAIRTTHAPLWNELREQADGAVRRGPPSYRRDDGRSGDEQLWQRDVGNTMPVLATAYVLTGERKYLESAQEWALASCGYETWGLGRIDGMDLAAGHQLFGLGIVYDWCYADLDEAARQTIRKTLTERTSAMFEAAATKTVWWQRAYLQNHLWVNVCGMAVAGLALFDEVDDASMWIGLPLDKFQRTMAALGPDGASHEGVGYWQYGVEYMLKFMHLARERLDVDLYDNPWWQNTAHYAQYLSLPRNAWRRGHCIVDLADCPRGHWYGPDYLLRGLARQYRDGYAQWLAQEADQANVAAANAAWLNLVWFDPSVPATPPDGLPTLRHFDDMGIVSARSNWSGDESLVVFKCGPYIGHEAVQQFDYDPGGGHVHPDANHFVLFANGQWLVRDDGYRAKWTAQHNTLLIDGRGQLGEKQQWFQGSELLRRKARPRILRAVSNEQWDHVAGDATEAYPPDLGLRRYVRHLLFLEPDVLIVLDDVAVEKPRRLELRFHPEQRRAEQDDGSFLVRGERTVLRVEPLTPEGVTATAESLPAEGRHGEGEEMFAVRLATESSHWRNAVALSWASAGSEARQVALQADGDLWTFRLEDRKWTFHWARGTVEPAW